MKVQISFDKPDLEKALSIAVQVAPYVDIFEVGTLLIYHHGIKAIQAFKEAFPKKIIFADCKIADRGKDSVTLFAQAGADWVTVMAGTGKDVIHTTCSTAASLNVKVMLDLLDSTSLGQSALEAKNLGVSALLLHQPYDEEETLTFLDKWDMVKGNTTLPIFISAKISRANIQEILNSEPDGIIIDKCITNADNPAQEAQYFYELASKY
ncbi:MAG: orotidine 5'-phosphate decarboxylase [Candidatus Babeliales bacterium]|nr:orotidine 5'-phosphate decarboxylase [Candidatus Babeliales bacterium]